MERILRDNHGLPTNTNLGKTSPIAYLRGQEVFGIEKFMAQMPRMPMGIMIFLQNCDQMPKLPTRT